jgi:hypothetical protein
MNETAPPPSHEVQWLLTRYVKFICCYICIPLFFCSFFK